MDAGVARDVAVATLAYAVDINCGVQVDEIFSVSDGSAEVEGAPVHGVIFKVCHCLPIVNGALFVSSVNGRPSTKLRHDRRLWRVRYRMSPLCQQANQSLS